MFSVSQVTKLRKELELNELKKKTESCSVDTALMALQTLVGRPPALFDSYAAIEALEELSLSTEVCGWAILEVSDNPQKVSLPGGGRILIEYPDQISGLEGGSWDW